MNKLLQIYSKKITVPTGMVNGIMGVNVDDDFSSTDSEDESQYEQYEQDFVKQEMKKYAKESTEGLKMTNNYESMSEVEGVEGFEYKNNAFDIYQQYNFTTTFIKKELPIDSFKEKILHLLEINNVIIIQGPTGCGKTTQVPQYILDYCREKTQYCNIAVTQPRKIATINVARRVCEERGWALGTICGYQVGLEKQISPNVLLTYMTTGVLLQKIISAKSLNQFTHVIIDEVHERNQELDFLLLIVRRFLFTNSSGTKVILMSATIDAEEFSHYFRSQSLTMSLPASIVYVNKKSTFTKTIFYMEQLTSAIRSTNAFIPDYDINMPEISEGIWKVFTFLVSIIDKLDTEDVVTNKKVIGSILVFLPGINEIEEAERRLTRHYKETREKNKDEGEKIKWEIIPLHSSLPNDEQAKVFKPTSPGYRKVILSTNIAESSVTVPGSYYVIDFCQTKVMTVDPITKFMSLKLEWASHVNCEQRAGRVGRIGNGRVYRLVPRDFYNEKMSRKGLPEIMRAPLERVVLQAKMLNLNDTPQQILALALNPPNLKNIENTVLTLKEIGALLQTCRGITSNSDGDITFLGTVMASLPIDVRLSKLIILGHLFSCLEDAVVIAAGCSIQNIFSLPFQQKFNAYKKLLLWADQSCSDLIALLNLYNVWQSYRRDNPFENVQAELQWCRLNLVSLKGLREWNLLVTEIKQRLESLHIKETTGPGRIALSHIDRPLILKVIIAGSFYPNYFIRCPDEVQLDEREAVKTVGGRDPTRTVYFTGMDPTQPGPLYVRAIKEMLKNETGADGDIVIGFDGSSKIYVEFKTKKTEQVAISVDGFQRITNTIPGKISTEMYEVIRKRQLGHKFELKLLPSAEAWEWAEKNGIMRNTTLQILTASSVDVEEKNCFSEVVYSPIPTLDIQHLTLKITEQIDAGHFWANTLESEYYLAQIEESLNKQILYSAVKVEGRLNMGKFYAARYIEDNLFYRCKINSMAQNILQIIFIDYGNIQQASPSDIYILPDRPECRLPPLAIECVLHGIQPSLKHNPKGVWSEKVNNLWQRQTSGVLLFGKVYSVVDDVVYLELYKSQTNTGQVKSINEVMLEQGYAEPSTESYLSRADHEKRMRVANAENSILEAARLSKEKMVNYDDFDAPVVKENYKIIQLRGPFSPLEIKLHGCIESSLNKSVDIDGSSVNTVLLDTELQNYHTRLLVAGYVGQTMNGARLRLRQTTMLPNIPGLPMLLSLLFCPTMRVKLSNDGTRVASILCGLGYNEYTDKAYYQAHDLSLVLDTELTEDEVNKINQIRFYMNQGVKLMYDLSQEMVGQQEMIRTQNSLKKELIELIRMPRRQVERLNVKFANVWWKNNIDAVILKPSTCDDAEFIWPLLWFVKLNNIKNYSPNVSKNLDDLDQIARNMTPVPPNMMCELCREPVFDVYEVREHLVSNSHKEAFKEFNESINNFEYASDDDDSA